MNIDQTAPDCCNFMWSHARVIGLRAPNTAGQSRVGFVEAASASDVSSMMKSDLWLCTRDSHLSKTYGSTFTQCKTWGFHNTRSRPTNDPALDDNIYLCAGRQLTENTYRPGGEDPSRFLLTVFDKIYVKIVAFAQYDRGCNKGNSPKCEGENIYDWQIEHVRQPSRFTGSTTNYNIPNDLYLWKLGDLLFGSINGVGSCAA